MNKLSAARLSKNDKVGLTTGLTITALSRLFRMDKKTVGDLLVGLEPSGEVSGFPIYHIASAASRLVAPSDEQVTALIKKMNPSKLPVKLRKEFWDSALSRQKYEENAGDLWRTVDVQELLIDVFKTMRTQIMLFSDTVDREVNLTNAQRCLIQEMSDDLLQQVSKALIERKGLEKLKPVLDVYDEGETYELAKGENEQ